MRQLTRGACGRGTAAGHAGAAARSGGLPEGMCVKSALERGSLNRADRSGAGATLAVRMGHEAPAAARPDFTAHNILLPDGTQTFPEGPLLSEAAETRAMLRSMLLLAPPVRADGSRRRVVDLGTLEGGYAVEFARAGYDVLAIEARAGNMAKCEWVAAQVGLPNLAFVRGDVRNVPAHGEFDVAFCSGLLYHLDEPSSFLRTLGEVTTRLLVLHTHFAVEDDPQTAYAVGPLTEHDGRRGKAYSEYSAGASEAEVEADPWASYGNAVSFWLEKKDLLQSVVDAGFPIVYEQRDFVEDIVGNPYLEKEFRSLFIGVKP